MPGYDTIAALATPSGRSALACVRASGPAVPHLVSSLFTIKKVKPRRSYVSNYTSVDGRVADEVVFVYYKSPDSYTGEDLLEISCHGNPLIITSILNDLMHRGCRMAEPGEFTKTAFINGKLDLTQAEAVQETIQASSMRALQIAQKQLWGSISTKINDWIQSLIGLIAHLEAYIDFPEEDLPEEDPHGPQMVLNSLVTQLQMMIASSQYRSIMQEGIRTVIMGAPNAGKSSLLNALLGRERALVSAEPGTTRDYVEDQLHIGPYLLKIVDTAGIREHAGTIERLGIEKTIEQLQLADVVLWVTDCTASSPTLPNQVSDLLAQKPCVLIRNKCDLIKTGVYEQATKPGHIINASSLTGEGIPAVFELLEKLIASEIDGIGPDQIVISARHAHALSEAKSALIAAQEILRQREPTELAATELRIALEAMGRITGKIDNERVLDELFATFCIGK